MTSPAHEFSSHPPVPASGGLGSLVKKFVSVERRAALKKFAGSMMIPVDWIYCAVTGFPYQTDWQLRGFPVLVCRSGGRLRIGKRWKAVSRLTANSMGVTQPVYLNISSGAALEIGDDVGMSGCSIACRQSISIGDRVLVGTGAVITDNDAHPIHPDFRTEDRLTATAPVKIESDVFIGARSFILKGVTIGRGAVVGAAAVVTKDVPPFAIVAGNPARVIGDSRQHHPTNPSTTPTS